MKTKKNFVKTFEEFSNFLYEAKDYVKNYLTPEARVILDEIEDKLDLTFTIHGGAGAGVYFLPTDKILLGNIENNENPDGNEYPTFGYNNGSDKYSISETEEGFEISDDDGKCYLSEECIGSMDVDKIVKTLKKVWYIDYDIE